METLVVKSDSSKESFNINKIKESLIKSGADNQTVNLALSKLDKYSKNCFAGANALYINLYI